MNTYWSPQDVLNAGKRKTPSKRLLAYLEDFRLGRLTTGTPEHFDSYAAQRKALVDIIKSQYTAQGLHQTVRGSNGTIPNFWELLFTLHHLIHEIELTSNMGYYNHQIGAGIFTTKEQSYAEFTIVGPELVKSLESGSNSKPKTYKVSLNLDRRSRKLTLRVGTKKYLVRQYKNVESATYAALLKLYTYAGEPLATKDLMGPNAKTVLKDIPNNIGLKGVLREQFIESGYTNKQRTLTLHKSVDLSEEDYMHLSAELVKN